MRYVISSDFVCSSLSIISLVQVCEDVLLPNLNSNDYLIFENLEHIETAGILNGYPLSNVKYYVERRDGNVFSSKMADHFKIPNHRLFVK